MKKKIVESFFIAYATGVCAQDKALTAKNTTDNNRTVANKNMIANQTTKVIDDEVRQNLILAQQKTKELFETVEKRGLIVGGKSESELRAEIVALAKDLFGTE